MQLDRETLLALADVLRPEQIASFKRAFIDRGGDYISIDGWSPAWAREDAATAYKLGLLTFEECGDEQYTELRYRPTKEFRRALANQEPING